MNAIIENEFVQGSHNISKEISIFNDKALVGFLSMKFEIIKD